ncbi:hypothetical protein SSX86_000021 [Deinandra increscens subsp. villosa]|uniref:Terpene synthase metal-binding domain-containing protein n=1 Tax=Deinandra increscens subsp. villosa TaxID=3103831 RepID=A0AAP0HBR2_9ASTR
MVEARKYLLHFGEEISRYDSLLTLAKLHFNYLQLLQKEELRIVTEWWKELELQVETCYVRDRVPECYIWILSLFSEPYYSQARIITTKVILLVLVLDDTYDAYATIEEIRLLTNAINRWDIGAMSQLPEYIKPFYEIILKEYAKMSKQGEIQASKQAFQEQAAGYLQEAEWRHSGEVPSFEEYMKIGLATSTHDLLCKSALIGMGKIVTQEAFAWYQSHPKIMIASQSISRLQDDIMTVEFERERAPSATGVDAYMKTFGVSENVAIDEVEHQSSPEISSYQSESSPQKVEIDVVAQQSRWEIITETCGGVRWVISRRRFRSGEEDLQGPRIGVLDLRLVAVESTDRSKIVAHHR